METHTTDLPGVLLIEPRVFGDPRGYFFEAYNATRYAAAGVAVTFVQDNLSSSTRGVLRGLHFQNPHPQGKLVQVLAGEVFDVALDIRRGSPTFGRWYGAILSAENHRQLYLPPGLAHGFCVMSEVALFNYKCSDLYAPGAEAGVAWDDPDLGIDWPVVAPTLSDKDRAYPRLRDLDTSRLLPF